MIEPRITLSLQLADGAPPAMFTARLSPAQVELLSGEPGPQWQRDEELDSLLRAAFTVIRLQLESRKKE